MIFRFYKIGEQALFSYSFTFIVKNHVVSDNHPFIPFFSE